MESIPGKETAYMEVLWWKEMGCDQGPKERSTESLRSLL